MAKVILWLHGLGDTGDGWRHLGSEFRFGSSVNYVHPDAPTQPVTCNNGFRMTSWMDLDTIPVSLALRDDEPGLNASSKIIHALLDKEVDKGTPSESIILGGFSHGGAMALLAGFTYPKKLAGVVCFSGWPALKESLVERVRSGANANTPVFIAHGSADEIVLPECGAKAHELMTAAGVPSTFNVYEGVQHSTSRAQMQEAKDWIQEQLKL